MSSGAFEVGCLPPLLQDKAEEALRSVEEAYGRFPWQPESQEHWVRALVLSDFLKESVLRHRDMMVDLIDSGDLDRVGELGQIADRWRDFGATIEDEPGLFRQLRRFRQREMFRIVWRDMLGKADLKETMANMTELAEVCIERALEWLYDDACRQWGTPFDRSPEGQPQRMVVLGMGKFGAHELNVSSDIDLIFVFPHNGETRGGSRALDNQQFFVRLGQRLIQALDKTTEDGFVFRTDMRLRPYGQSGALALSFAAMEEYYQDQGREWERYAMIKARVVAGDRLAGQQLMSALKPFVYRRYIDFSAFESLRGMKAMISREVRRKGLENNIKLGAGGIRETEFIVQAFQLIRGGREADLQVRELLTVLFVLRQRQLLPAAVVDSLREAYCFLRRVEHILQGIADRQTQTLPDNPQDQARVACAMGFVDWPAFQHTLNAHRDVVSQHFADIISSDEEETDNAECDETWQELWQGEIEEAAAVSWLSGQGFEVPEDSYQRLQALRASRVVQTLQSQGRRRLHQFMPILLQALSDAENPSRTLERVLVLVEAVLRRSAYLVLLNENPPALEQLVRLCSASPWIAEQLAETPLLLDELLNTHSLYSPPTKIELEDELRQQLLRIPAEDLEEQMECLRHFKKAHVLRVAASEIRGTLPLMKVSDYLTWIAEVVLAQVVMLAWHNLVEKHGRPGGIDSDPETAFAVIGYGKLGGIELGYTSDLDLVFIHDADPTLSTDGAKPVENGVFFTRLGQRIVHILNTQTPSGLLYEVDMRLRPSGNSGLLVSSLSAFDRYQHESAWTWEHQALVRARWLAGSPAVGHRFEALRREVLGKHRDIEQLRQEVVSMREKMRDALATPVPVSGEPEAFHLKQDPGGIIDIEFMVQFLILSWTQAYPSLARWSDNIRQLEALGECGLLAAAVTERLREIYIAMRSTIHRRALQKQNSRVEAEAFVEERAFVMAQWALVMGAGKQDD
ncbi:bifunctional [glutamate--ammonia ligase]-adenylyl-L-tyrosine phosphorylase/[glutamate--ammonia-ligase] adenylyltransferase [Mangrovitalea sediminis]|nr:bifunctional [glutamate--ammonia ligase]-adenylyl-L-tyrosine phosphorylase/[glutamate--ammonia-ligase] adenylyltransferase [Mangrovitalea sediminis]